MGRLPATLVALILCLAAGLAAAAQPDLLRDLERLERLRESVEVEAESVDYDAARRRLVARGGVRLAIERAVISADEVIADLDDLQVTATGNVVLSDGENRLEGERIEYDLKTNLGTVTRGRGLLAPGISLEGARIRREGPRRFRLEDGRFTACRICQAAPETPDWEFRAADATLDLDDYVIARHASFWVRGLPALYSPLLAVPVSPRRTGFLIPRTGVGGKDGFKLTTPFFWAISPSQDITLTPTYRTNRGFDASGEYRYVLAEDSRGQLFGRYLYDLASPSGQRDRSEFRWLHSQIPAPTWDFKADVRYLSDRTLSRDFVDSSVADRTQRTISSNVFLARATTDYMALGLVNADQDLAETTESRSTRLPEGRFLWLPAPLLQAGLVGEGSATAAYLERNRSADAGRLALAPTLSLPLAVGPWLVATSGLGLRETAYTTSALPGGDQNRLLLEATQRLTSRLLRGFSDPGLGVERLTHVVEPSLAYRYVPWVDQRPFPQFDETDFVSPQNRLTFRLSNRLVARLPGGERGAAAWEVAQLDLAQSLNLQPRRREFSDIYLAGLTPERVDQAVEGIQTLGTGFSQAAERVWSNLVVRAAVAPMAPLRLYGTVAVNPERPQAEGINTGAELRWQEWLRLDLAHTYVRDQQANGLVGRAEVQATKSVFLDFLTRLDAHSGSFLENAVGLRYSSCCWEVSLKYTYRSDGPGQTVENDIKLTFDIKVPTPPTIGAARGGSGEGR